MKLAIKTVSNVLLLSTMVLVVMLGFKDKFTLFETLTTISLLEIVYLLKNNVQDK